MVEMEKHSEDRLRPQRSFQPLITDRPPAPREACTKTGESNQPAGLTLV